MASRVNGFNEMVARLNSYSTNVQQEVKGLVDYHLGEIEIEATALAPGNTIQTEGEPIPLRSISTKRQGNLAINQNIGYYVETSGYKGTVFVEKSVGAIAAYTEYGTGQSAATYLATVPQYWRAEARRWYVNGLGTITAQPYMLPAFLKGSIAFQKDLKKVFKQVRL